MNAGGNDDPFFLKRFLDAQEHVYAKVLSEIRRGRKQRHWMWFIFPQISGLGHSDIAQHYAIKRESEAREYLRHPMLGARMLECTLGVLAIKNRTASEILGFPDDMKLKSSMTLFSVISDVNSLFDQVLDKYYRGEKDDRTLQLLSSI